MSERGVDLMRLLDLIEPALDIAADAERMPLIVRRVARNLRGSGLVQRDTTDEGVVAAGLLAYATASRAAGYDPAAMAKEIGAPLATLIGVEQAARLLRQWCAGGVRQAA